MSFKKIAVPALWYGYTAKPKKVLLGQQPAHTKQNSKFKITIKIDQSALVPIDCTSLVSNAMW